MNKLLAYIRQPLNQAAIGALLTDCTAALNGTISWHAAIPLAVGAVFTMVIPDNVVLKEDVEQLVSAVLQAAPDAEKPNAPTPDTKDAGRTKIGGGLMKF